MSSLRSVLPATFLVFALGTAVQAQTTLGFVGTEAPETWAPLIAAFEAKHPEAKIEYQQIPFNSYNAQIEARVGSEDPGIDVLMADTPRVPTLATRGLLLQLDDFADQIEAITTESELSAVSYQGEVYAFPMWTGMQVLYYNKDMFEAAGLELPSADVADRLTWEELLEMAQAIQATGVDYGFTFAQPDRYFQLQPLFESVGAGSGLTGDNLLTPDITNDGWVRVGQWYQDLYESGIAPRGVTPEQTSDLFTNGGVAMIYGGLPLINRYNRVEGFNYGAIPVPVFADGKPVTSTGSWSIGISPHSDDMELALAFAQFISFDEEGTNLAMQQTSAVPVNQVAYPNYLERLSAATQNVGPVGDILVYELQNTAVPRPRSPGYVIFETVMNQAFSDIRNGADVRSTLEAAQNQLTSQLSRIR